MEAETFDEESNQVLSQINIDLQVNDDLFDIGSDSVLSQFSMDDFLKNEDCVADCANSIFGYAVL